MILEFLWEYAIWICVLTFIALVAAIFMDYTGKDWDKFEDDLDKMFRDYEERKRKGESE
jgi:hypothetical protein